MTIPLNYNGPGKAMPAIGQSKRGGFHQLLRWENQGTSHGGRGQHAMGLSKPEAKPETIRKPFGGFHSHGDTPIAGWFLMENPI